MGFLAPPWHDTSEGGKYGPTGLSGYERALERYHASIHGGGLWDFDECRRRGDPGSNGIGRSTPLQFDRELIRAYAAEHHLDGNQLDAFLCVVEEGQSIRSAARRLGKDRCNVRRDLRTLERKAKRWQAVRAKTSARATFEEQILAIAKECAKRFEGTCHAEIRQSADTDPPYLRFTARVESGWSYVTADIPDLLETFRCVGEEGLRKDLEHLMEALRDESPTEQESTSWPTRSLST